MIPRILGLLTAAILLLPRRRPRHRHPGSDVPRRDRGVAGRGQSIPFVAIEIWFNGGASLDAPGKRGAVHLMTGLLEEGAEDMDARAFAEAVEGLAASFEFDVYRDALTVSARMLTENREEAADLLRAALVAPLRRGRGGTGARTGPVDHRRRRARPRRDRGPDLQRHGLGRSPLWQRAGRHAGERQCADPRRSGRRAPRRSGTRPRDRGRRRRHHGGGAGPRCSTRSSARCPRPARRCPGWRITSSPPGRPSWSSPPRNPSRCSGIRASPATTPISSPPSC
jgi:hypothetical protein